MYHYLHNLIWEQEEKEFQVDDRQKHLKYLLLLQLKSSKIKLKPIKKQQNRFNNFHNIL